MTLTWYAHEASGRDLPSELLFNVTFSSWLTATLPKVEVNSEEILGFVTCLNTHPLFRGYQFGVVSSAF